MYFGSLMIIHNNFEFRYFDGETTQQQYVGGAGVLKVVESFGDKTSVSYSAVFTAIATGNCDVTVDNGLWSAGGSTETAFAGASATLTVKDIKLSDNANLSSLSINTGAISPKFSKNTTTYTASVPFEVLILFSIVKAIALNPFSGVSNSAKRGPPSTKALPVLGLCEGPYAPISPSHLSPAILCTLPGLL